MLFLSITLPIFLIGLMLVGMVMVIEKHEKQVLEEPSRNVILPASLTQEDFDWFCWSMEMAGLDKDRVINTCSCGYATECYMHCNHYLNDGKCTGHAYKPMKASWAGKFEPVKADQRIADFKAKMIAKRTAKLKAEFEAGIRLPKPQYISQPTSYDPLTDCYTVYGKKISRLMLEDLIYNGHLTPQQVRELMVPDYGTLEEVRVFGQREPVAYMESPPDVSWIKMERLGGRKTSVPR